MAETEVFPSISDKTKRRLQRIANKRRAELEAK